MAVVNVMRSRGTAWSSMSSRMAAMTSTGAAPRSQHSRAVLKQIVEGWMRPPASERISWRSSMAVV